MEGDSRGEDRMEIVDESNDGEEEDEEEEIDLVRRPGGFQIRTLSVGDAYRRLLGSLRNARNSSRNSSEDSAPNSTNAANRASVNFDTELPTEHSYLGNMTPVSGVSYLDAGKTYRMLIFVNHSMVFPGETLPMIIPEYLFDSTMFTDDALLFGVIFPRMWKLTKPKLFGVTCQIYEKGSDAEDNVIIKCRVHQRFIVTKECNNNFAELLEPFERKVYAVVRILPEIILPDPVYSLRLGSLNRFRDIASLDHKIRQMQASTTIWPQFVFNQHRLDAIIARAKKYITSYKIESMPTDLTFMSFWLCRNLVFDFNERTKLFITNSVNMRLQIIEKSLNKNYFSCRRCKTQIADCSALFAMSKHGVQANYCNPSGFIHETNTVRNIKADSVYFSGQPSTEFSWFPGYSWQILVCRMCEIHIGWKFSAVESNLIPKKFYALSGVNVIVDLPSDGESLTDDEDDFQESDIDFIHYVEETDDEMPAGD